MQLLREVTINNFRSCRDCHIPLADFTPLVGYNNGGKSNILDAIQWLLDGNGLYRRDFCDSDETVSVTGIIEGVTEELLELLIKKHRDRISPFCADGVLTIRRSQSKPSGYKRDVDLEVWDPDEEEGGEWRKNPTGIDSAISALFPSPIMIGAMEDATEDVGRSKSTTTIGKLISAVTEPIQEAHGATIQGALDEIRHLLEAEGEERAQELVEFDQAANEIVKELFPGIEIALHVPPPELNDLFKSGTIRVFEADGEEAREVQALGHGAQRSIQMALVRYLADVGSEADDHGTRTLLLIDEPELYLHPQAVFAIRSALRDLATGEYQVVFATHSPQMVGLDDVADTLIVRKSLEKGTHPLATVREAVTSTIEDAPSQAKALFEFANASQLLFSDRVVIAEGTAERRLIPPVGNALMELDFDRSKTALVGIGSSTSVPKALDVLRVMAIPAKGVVDLDFAFRAAIQAELIEGECDEVKQCKELLADLANDYPIQLGQDGLPQNGPELSAEDSFAVLASDERAEPLICELHDRLLENDIWLWEKGSLEHHLGVVGKGEDVWGEYVALLQEQDPIDVIADPEGVRACLEWLVE